MSASLPRYDELYSISDLHLGGALPKGQIFCRGERLKAFLEALSKKPGPLALVIAGDLFDSLPYLSGTGTYVAVDGAAGIVEAIAANRPSRRCSRGSRPISRRIVTTSSS